MVDRRMKSWDRAMLQKSEPVIKDSTKNMLIAKNTILFLDCIIL